MRDVISCSYMSKLSLYKNIELSFWYLWGGSCVFMVPYIEIGGIRIRFVEVSTLLLFIALVIRINLEKKAHSKKRISSLLAFNILTYTLVLFWPLGGVLTIYALGYTPALASYIAPFRRLFIILILLVAYVHFKHEEWLLRERALIQGFLTGCVVTTVWMVVEQVAFLLFQASLNEIIFQELLGLDPLHTFTNLVGYGYTGLSMPLYRSTGFAWDPGQTAPLVALGWLFYNLLPETLVGKRRLLVSVFMFLVLPLSLSRTAIMGTIVITFGFMITCFIVSIAQASLAHKGQFITLRKPEFKFYWRSVVLGFTAIVILIGLVCVLAKISVSSVFQGLVSFVRSGLEAQTFGEQRHWTYFKLIPHALLLNWTAAFLGYGTANAGVAMEKAGWSVLPQIEQMAAMWQGNWVPESTTVNFALMGGVVGFFALCLCIITSIAKASIEYLRKPWNIRLLGYPITLLAPFIFGLGYGFENTIIYVCVFLMLVHIWDPKIRYIN